MCGKRGPSTSDPVLHFGGFLVHEGYHLFQVLYFPLRTEYLNMHYTNFGQFAFWFVRILVLLVWISSPCAAVLFDASVL